MFGSLGVPEILFLLVLALLIFGPKRLPEIGRTVGKGLSEFRRASSDLKRSFDVEMSALERETAPAPTTSVAAQAPVAAPSGTTAQGTLTASPVSPPDGDLEPDATPAAARGQEIGSDPIRPA